MCIGQEGVLESVKGDPGKPVLYQCNLLTALWTRRKQRRAAIRNIDYLFPPHSYREHIWHVMASSVVYVATEAK